MPAPNRYAPPPWSIFGLKRVEFQTIRSAVSRKKRGFSAWFGSGGAVPPSRGLPLSKAKRSRETLRTGKIKKGGKAFPP